MNSKQTVELEQIINTVDAIVKKLKSTLNWVNVNLRPIIIF